MASCLAPCPRAEGQGKCVGVTGQLSAAFGHGQDNSEEWREQRWDFTCSVHTGVTLLPLLLFFFEKWLNAVGAVSETQNSICAKF